MNFSLFYAVSFDFRLDDDFDFDPRNEKTRRDFSGRVDKSFDSV